MKKLTLSDIRSFPGFKAEGKVLLSSEDNLPVLRFEDTTSKGERIYLYTPAGSDEIIYVGSTTTSVKLRAVSHWGRMVKTSYSPKEYVPSYKDRWLPKLKEVSEMSIWSIEAPKVEILGETVSALYDTERALIKNIKPCLNLKDK
jgi:hypothetical protein